ncbi:magnesium transporter [Candidatus Woesearchaeota archaeon]|nr:magnesium transporter [Candidatus Woesearchaeota archaeon]
MNWEDFKEMLVAELVSMTGGIAAGTILAFYTDKLALIPGLFILMPGFLAMRGSISASLAARISAALHLHKKSAERERSYFGKQNVHASFLLAIVTSFILGIVAYAGTRLIFNVDSPAILLISVIAAFISNVLMIPITFATTVWLFKKGYDPDNIMGPYITTIGDVVSILSLLTAIYII